GERSRARPKRAPCMQSALRLLRTAVGAWLLPAALLRLLPGLLTEALLRLLPGLLTAALIRLFLRVALLLAAGPPPGVGHQRHPAKAVLVTSPRPAHNLLCLQGARPIFAKS